MVRNVLLAALAVTALATLPFSPLAAGREWHSKFDDADPITEAWTSTGQFDGVVLAGSDDVFVTRGDRWQVRASGDPEVLADLRFMVENGKLTVGRRWRRDEVRGTARIEVTAPRIEEATLAGSGQLSVDAMRSDKVDATVAGSGTMRIDRVDAGSLSATVAGSGDLAIAGSADKASITIAGSGDIAGTALRVGSASVTIAGSGSARFASSGKISGSIVGSGDARVTGTTDCTQSRIGSGHLICSR